VLAAPFRVADLSFVDSLLVPALDLCRDRQPLRPLGSLDPVAVSPIATRELAIIEENELVD
jgi:hypothetical protein